jgi:hypothetical protein
MSRAIASLSTGAARLVAAQARIAASLANVVGLADARLEPLLLPLIVEVRKVATGGGTTVAGRTGSGRGWRARQVEEIRLGGSDNGTAVVALSNTRESTAMGGSEVKE